MSKPTSATHRQPIGSRVTWSPVAPLLFIALAAGVPVTAASAHPSPASCARTGDACIIAHYPLTMRVLAAWKATGEAVRADPALLAEDRAAEGAGTIAQRLAALAAHPRLLAAVQAHGLTARDLVLFPLAVATAAAADAMEDAKGNGPISIGPHDIGAVAVATRQQLAFYRRHRADIDAAMAP